MLDSNARGSGNKEVVYLSSGFCRLYFEKCIPDSLGFLCHVRIELITVMIDVIL